MKSFRLRGPDRRQGATPVVQDRRQGGRRFEDATQEPDVLSAQLSDALSSLARTVEEKLARVEGRLSLVPSDTGDEATQIPTRNPHLKESMHTLAAIEAEVIELVRKLRARGPLASAERKRILALVQRIMGVDRGMADLMARRLGRLGDTAETRGTRFLSKVEKLIA